MEDSRFTLTRVRLKHYRSIAAADVELGKFVLLVGPNGSGKSNFLDALRLVSESLQTSLGQALRSRGGAAEVSSRATRYRFSIDLEFHGPGYEGDYGFEIMTTLGGLFRISRESCAVRRDAQKSEDLDSPPSGAGFRVEAGVLAQATEAVMPPVSVDRLYLVAAAGIDDFRPVYDGLAGIGVFNLNPDAMRLPQPPDSGDFLRRDGSNIASVLRRLEDTSHAGGDKARIESYLQQIVPGMQHVVAAEVGNWETLEFRQAVPGAEKPWRFQPQSVSDGTLRALGVLVSLFAGTGGTLSTVGIEETRERASSSGDRCASRRAARCQRSAPGDCDQPQPRPSRSPRLRSVRTSCRPVHRRRDQNRAARPGWCAGTSRRSLHSRRAAPDGSTDSSGHSGHTRGGRRVNSVPIVAPIVEGHGEVGAVRELISRIGLECFGTWIDVAQPFRLDSAKMRKPDELAKAIRVRAARVGNHGGVLVLRDGDDDDIDCPVTLATALAPKPGLVSGPVEIVIAFREYEAWLLAAVESLRGHLAVRDDACSPANPERQARRQRAVGGPDV